MLDTSPGMHLAACEEFSGITVSLCIYELDSSIG